MDNVRTLPWHPGVYLRTDSVMHDDSDGFGDHTAAILCTYLSEEFEILV